MHPVLAITLPLTLTIIQVRVDDLLERDGTISTSRGSETEWTCRHENITASEWFQGMSISDFTG